MDSGPLTRLGISRSVQLFKSVLIEVPVVLGWFRPIILLPVSTLTGLTLGQVELLLAHELAHIRRFDYWVNWAQIVIETVLFYHPAVGWISRCVREDRELCCDELAIEACGDRLGYARALASLEELRGRTPHLALAASDGSLFNRFRHILRPTPASGSPWQVSAGRTLLLVGVLICLIGFAIALALPTVFVAHTRVAVASADE